MIPKTATQVKSRELLIAALALLILGAAFAQATASGAPAELRPADATRPVAFAPVSGAPATTVKPSTALENVLARMDSPAIASARIDQAPPDVQRVDPARADLPWFYATVRVPAMSDGLEVRPLWEADLLQGVVAEHAGPSDNLRADFGGSTLRALMPDGTAVEDAGGGMGDVARGQEFSTAPDDAVGTALRSELHDLGLRPISIHVLRPSGPAPAVVISAADPVQAARDLVKITKALFGNPPRYEGYYLELRTAGGFAVARLSASFRTGAGRAWRAEGWEDEVAVQSSRWAGVTRPGKSS